MFRHNKKVSDRKYVGTAEEVIAVETAWPSTHADFAKEFVQQTLKGWFAQQGVRINDEEARYLVRVTLHAFGLDKAETFFGIPAIQSVLIPFALPGLTLYGSVSHRGYTRFTMDLYETERTIDRHDPDVGSRRTLYALYRAVSDHVSSTDMIPPPVVELRAFLGC